MENLIKDNLVTIPVKATTEKRITKDNIFTVTFAQSQFISLV